MVRPAGICVFFSPTAPQNVLGVTDIIWNHTPLLGTDWPFG